MSVLRSDCIYKEIEPIWGHWWDAATQVDFNNPDTFMTGRLTGNCVTGFMLEVHDSDYNAWNDNEDITILGATTGGREITLRECRFKHATIGANPRYIYKPTIVIDGGHFPNPDDLDFTQVSFGLHGLEEWIDPIIELPSGNRGDFSNITLSSLFKADILSTPNAKAHIEESRIHYLRRGALQLLIESKLRVVINANEGERMSWGFFKTDSSSDSFSSLASTVIGVFSLASSTPTYMYDMEVKSNKYKRVIGDTEIHDKIKVYWNVLVRGEKSAYDKTDLNDWIINWTDIKSDPSKYLTAWHENKTSCSYVESILAATKFEGTMLVDQRFLDLYTGINGLYQLLYLNGEQDFLMANCENIRSLIRDYATFISDFLGNEEQTISLCDDIFTVAKVMFVGKSPAVALSSGYGLKVGLLNIILTSILRMGLMHKSGFSSDEVKEIMRNDRYLRWALNNWKSTKRE